MKLTNITKLFFVIIVAATITSCDLFEKADNSYQGPPKVEFTPLSDLVQLGPEEKATVTVTAQLIGEQRSAALEFGVEVVDSLTTAVEGDHYSLPSNTVTIPADSSSANYAINVMGNKLSPDQTVKLAIELQAADNVEPAQNLKTYTLTLQGAD